MLEDSPIKLILSLFLDEGQMGDGLLRYIWFAFGIIVFLDIVSVVVAAVFPLYQLYVNKCSEFFPPVSFFFSLHAYC